MGLSKVSLLIGLLFSAALLVSARELTETGSMEGDGYGGYHGYHHPYYRPPHYHYPPTTERKTLQMDELKPDYYYHHYPHYPYHHPHYPPTTSERKTLESSDVKPDYYHHYGYPYHHYYHGGYGGHYPPQGKEAEKGN